MTIRAVIFDLDNTLTHRDLSIQAFARTLFQQYAAQIKDAQESHYQQILEIIRYIDHGGYPIRERMTIPTIGGSVADRLLKKIDWVQAPSLEALTAFWFDQFGSHAVPMPDAEKVLIQLKERHLKLAIISNGGHSTRLNIIQGLGFGPYFDEIISSELLGVSKPNAEIFQETCKRLECEPEECLYVGDHPVNDYVGATSAGLKALFLAGFHQVAPDNSPPQQDTIQQLNQILEHI